MPSPTPEFKPGPFDATATILDIRNDLSAFNVYIEQEFSNALLFGSIVNTLSESRRDEVRIETDAVDEDPRMPIGQTIFYPLVNLGDGEHALLSEQVLYDRSDRSTVARIPWLYILSAAEIADIGTDNLDSLQNKSTDTYGQFDLDRTGRGDEDVPFSDALKVFLLHPSTPKEINELEQEKQRLLSRQVAYTARLRAIAGAVLHTTG